MSPTPRDFTSGPAPRHLELARLAIGRARATGEPLERAIAWAIDTALGEASAVPDLSNDGRFRSIPRALAILRLRGSATPSELATAIGWMHRHQAWYVLRRLVVRGFARRAGGGRYVPATPQPVGRPPNACRRRGAA